METPNTNAPGGKQDSANGRPPLDLSSVKRGPGRPKGSGAKRPENHQSEKSESRAKTDTKADSAFLKDSAVCLLEIVDEVSAKHLANKIRKFAPERREEFIQLYREVGLNAKDKQMVGMSVDAIAQKYSWLTKFGPEMLLFVALSQYGVRQARLHKFVADVADEAKKRGTAPIKTKVEETPAPDNSEKFPGPVSAGN